MGDINWKLKEKICDKFNTQADFSQEIGLCDTLVSKIIRGRRKLDEVGQRLWAGVLECEVADIFEEA